ncbi:hypothetical protein [Treponema sp.]|uniref:hypothetical protein n=1 Tax=Treponema sp. TaxID=166 RepID=UPI003F0B9644
MNSINYKLKNIDRSFLFKLTGRTFLFFLLFSVFLATLYISGTYQDFLNSTQSFILALCSLSCLGLFIFSAAGIIQSAVFFFVTKRKSYWIFFAIYFTACIFSSAVFVAARIISIAAKGV